jgi:hypothetical protein
MLVRLGRLLALTTTCLLAVELTCRLDDWLRYGTPLLSPFTSPNDLSVRDVYGAHGRPFAQYTKYILNNLGMRGPNVAPSKPSGVIRIVTAGASETFGLYESLGHEYPRQLEDSLRSCAPRFQVLNAAFIGMSLPTQEQDLRLRIAPLRPDVVVLYPTPVQYLSDPPPSATPPDSTPGAGRLSWTRWTSLRAGKRLTLHLDGLIPARVRNYLRHRSLEDEAQFGGRFVGAPADRLARYETDLRHIIATVRSIGARPVLMTHADVFMADGPSNRLLIEQWRRFYPRASGTTLLQFDSAAAVVTRRVAAEQSVPLVDLAEIVRDRLPRPVDRFFGDYAHFTDAGAGVVAAALRPAVLGATGVACRDISVSRTVAK